LDRQADLSPGRAGYRRLRPMVLLDRTAVAKNSPRAGQHDELLEPGNDLSMGNPLRNDENHVWARSAQPPRVPVAGTGGRAPRRPGSSWW
jgi:hypothetical protein